MSLTGLRLAFAGTPRLAATILKAILAANVHKVCLVYTQPDRRSGRGRQLQVGPVKQLAENQCIPILQPQTPAEIKPEDLEEVDALLVAAYGMILPKQILDKPRLGCLNVHTSLLPKWRGAAPIQRAIEAGDQETGITIMQMDAGLDTGDILLQRHCPILADDNADTLEERLANMGGPALLDTLQGLTEGKLRPQKQDDSKANYAKKLSKEEAEINWSQPAVDIANKIRAFNPAPVAFSELCQKKLRIWHAEVLENENADEPPGTILDFSKKGLDVATLDKPLRLLKLQLPGKKALAASDFYNGNPAFLSAE